jgi:predicted permease
MELIGSIRRDVTHAMRSLAKDRVFTLVCVVSLGIGIGAVVALATLTRAITAPARGIDTNGLVELLVVPQGPLRAATIESVVEEWTYPDYQALREAAPGMAVTGWNIQFGEVGAPAPDDEPLPRVATLYVSANYFSTFGVSLARGPGFDPVIDDATSAEPRVVLSYDFWRSRMASDPDAVGKVLIVDDVPHTIVGIAPDGFHGHFHFFEAPGSMLFIPLERHPRLTARPGLRDDRTTAWLRMHGRLEPGVDITEANGLVSSTMGGLAERFPASNEFKTATVEPYYSQGAAARSEGRRAMSIILGLAGTVLVIICLNVSGMMMVRAASRERELSIRAALGATRQRLVQHLFFEAVLLAFAGGALSAFVLFGIPAAAAWYLGALVPQEIDFDAVNIAISAVLCLVVSVLCGLLPAFRFSRPDLSPSLKDDAGGGRRHAIRLHRVAAMVQIGVAVPFLVVSGVMLDRVRTAGFGFRTEGLAAARLPVPASPQQEAGFAVRRVRDSLLRTRGVQSVSVADGMPIDFDYRMHRVGSTTDGRFASVHVTRVDEHFLETLGVPILRGRGFTAEDRTLASAVAMISQPVADQLFPAAEPIGQQLTVLLEENREQQLTIVGLTADFATSQLTTERPQVLLPLRDLAAAASVTAAFSPEDFLSNANALGPTVFLIARGAPGDELQLKAALENALRELGVEALPGEAFPGIVTGQDLVQKSIADLIAESTAVGFAGGIVLILAALGIVGVVGFMAATRTREIAVRMALGSTRLRVFGMLLADVGRLAIPGVAGGLLLAAVLIRSIENVMGTPLTLGPTPLGAMEPVIYAGAATIAVGVAMLAGLPAARRATSVQPMEAMRTE